MHFFLIDDDPLMLKLQTRIISSAGHSVDTESDSANAMAHIRQTRPECIVTDLMMPGVDGYQLITMVRSDPELEKTILIVLSAKAFMQDMRQALDFGANGFIRKPIDPDSYLEEIYRILESSRV